MVSLCIYLGRLKILTGYRNDNDMYDHMNNSIYNFLWDILVLGLFFNSYTNPTKSIDSAVNAYLIEHCNLHPPTSTETPLAVHSHTDFFASIAYPAVAEVGVRVNRLGKSSVTYEAAIFEKGIDEVKAVGEFVHVFVERKTGRPTSTGMSQQLRQNLQRICIEKAKI